MKEWVYEKPQVQEYQPEEIPSEYKSARNKGLYYLQFSGKTEDEMRKKLAEQGFSPASVEDAVQFLKGYRYLDDEDYARRYIERNNRKKSVKQMKFELRRKGIPEDVLELVFEEIPVDEKTQIYLLLEKKRYSGDEADRMERQKISAYLARKGFQYEAISSAMNHYARKMTD